METILFITLPISVLLNIFLILYLRHLIPRIYFISENLNSLVRSVVEFRDHLNAVHELERFYGDETLGTLLKHSVGLVEVLDDFEDIYMLAEEEEDENDDEQEDHPDDGPEETTSPETA
jgi:hypothetical protein